MTDFGKHLAAIRKQRQLTQLELVNLLNIQSHMVGHGWPLRTKTG